MQAGSGRKSDRVGATWMTKENRLTDIQNYITFLNAIHKQEIPDARIPVTVLGFSQGSATASRWVLANEVKCDRLILWSGIFPPDMDFTTGKEILKDKEVWHVYGKQDPYLTDDRFKEMSALAQKIAPHAKQIAFDGEHEIENTTLLKFI
jgi:predicted esterase